MNLTLDIRGSGLQWIQQYLVRLGGSETAPGVIAGPGWTAALQGGTHHAFGTMVPQVTVTFSGDDETVQEAAQRLRLMVHRGGG